MLLPAIDYAGSVSDTKTSRQPYRVFHISRRSWICVPEDDNITDGVKMPTRL
jgi:hypothetical protein